ncbi:glycosyltransferase family 4 protein [Hymenobacter sp. BT188]|uniref:glycosyltransferase family 4 protein n=1 Tax=Hymenobacter sp. BT188 TaxID=2763504 RepID=UPI0016519B79|nr:glycosyltransferase family 4 protein [Hymenobacter sp. BT188]MBC6607164.1 glycosyltransferase family 4 protein [Hymenobacter sp. BT188]
MRIAFVSLMRAFPWGGSEELWFRAARLALAQGHSVCTLTQKWNKTPDKIKELERLGAEITFYDATQYNIVEKLAIKLHAKKNESDIVPNMNADVYILSNGSTWDFLYNYSLTRKILRKGNPYILISQHSFENGHIVKPGRREDAISIIKKAEIIFFVAERNLRAAERQLGHLITNSRVISNPINIKDVAVKAFPASARLLMACIARFDCDFKGQDILLQALSTEQWQKRDFCLKLYGNGPHLSHLKQLIEMYALHDKVTIEGHVADVDNIWQMNQVLVLPSLSEGTPLVMVEAMLSGRAVLTTNVGDNGRYVLDNKTGFLAATASVECLSQSLEDLWGNKNTLSKMGEAAYAHAVTLVDFQPEQTLLEYIRGVH